MGGRCSVTTAFDIRAELATGGAKQSEQRNEWLLLHIVAVYWVYLPLLAYDSTIAVKSVFRRCYQP